MCDFRNLSRARRAICTTVTQQETAHKTEGTVDNTDLALVVGVHG